MLPPTSALMQNACHGFRNKFITTLGLQGLNTETDHFTSLSFVNEHKNNQ